MICGKCDQPIKQGEAYRSYDVDRASGPGSTVHQHTACPKREPRP
ncbi:hypothetical protein [Streptomyces sp. A3M-1-3]|nr:hypothetical protein [Streptomyces sp. A3M-1-3]